MTASNQAFPAEVAKRLPLVSVIMGCYNVRDEAALAASVDSLLAQSYPNLEIIICNDGSTDFAPWPLEQNAAQQGAKSESHATSRTQQLLQREAAKDPRIRVIGYERNQGLAHALNTALAQARGQFIARQDDDDTSHPDRFLLQVDFLLTHPELAFVGTNQTLVHRDEADTGAAASATAKATSESGHESQASRERTPQDVRAGNQQIKGTSAYPAFPQARDFLITSPFSHPTVMFRADALRGVGGYRAAPDTRRCEDYDLFMRMYTAGLRGANLREALYDYTLKDKAKKSRTREQALAEARVRYNGFKGLGLLPVGLPFVAQPVVMSLLPRSIDNLIHS